MDIVFDISIYFHVITTVFVVACAIKWGDWKNWKKYHTTMIYIAMSDLLYNFIYYNHWLWQYAPNHTIADLVYSFVILPLTGLILLTNFPTRFKEQLFRIAKFIVIYYLFEIIFFRYGVISYDYGWNILWSLAWLLMMIPMFVLHHKKPLIAYAASTTVVIIMLILFPASFK